MKQITINIDDGVAERLEIASNILAISEGELINEQLLSYQGRSELFNVENGIEVFNCLGDPIERFIREVGELKAESGKFISQKVEPRFDLTVQLAENERMALEFFAKYEGVTPEEFAKNCLHRDFEGVVEGMEPRQEGGYWQRWLKNEHKESEGAA